MEIVSNSLCKTKVDAALKNFKDYMVIIFNFEVVGNAIVHQIFTYINSPVTPSIIAQATSGRWSAFCHLLYNIDSKAVLDNNLEGVIEDFAEDDPTELENINAYLRKNYNFYILYDDGRSMVLKRCNK